MEDAAAGRVRLGEAVLTLPLRERPRHDRGTSRWRPIRRNARLLAAGIGIAALGLLIAPPEGGAFLVVLLTMSCVYACVDAFSLLLTTRRRRLSVRERYERSTRRLPLLGLLVAAAVLAGGAWMATHPHTAGERTGGILIAALGGVALLVTVAISARRGVSAAAGISLSADRTRVRRGDTVTLRVRADRDGEPLRCGLVCAAFFDVPARHESDGLVLRYRAPRMRMISTHLRRVDEDATRRVRVPAAGPFSFEGESVCVVWTAVALVPGGSDVLDPKAAVEVPIEVLP